MTIELEKRIYEESDMLLKYLECDFDLLKFSSAYSSRCFWDRLGAVNVKCIQNMLIKRCKAERLTSKESRILTAYDRIAKVIDDLWRYQPFSMKKQMAKCYLKFWNGSLEGLVYEMGGNPDELIQEKNCELEACFDVVSNGLGFRLKPIEVNLEDIIGSKESWDQAISCKLVRKSFFLKKLSDSIGVKLRDQESLLCRSFNDYYVNIEFDFGGSISQFTYHYDIKHRERFICRFVSFEGVIGISGGHWDNVFEENVDAAVDNFYKIHRIMMALFERLLKE